jgi:hypothetical protein
MNGIFKTAMIAVFSLVLCSEVLLTAEAATRPLAFMQDNQLAEIKRQLAEGTAAVPTREAYDQLLASAEHALLQPDFSVTDKGMTPPSGSKHDYLSLSAYWWPDGDKPDGLPWIRRDGKVNPASKDNQSDGVRLAAFTARVQDLTLAWYFSGQQRFADKAASLLRTWFINPPTRMNPNLNYAQGVPGIASGRNAGVLDGRYFATRIVDALLMLHGNPAWSAEDEQQMHQWMTEYLRWLQHDPLALKERKTGNNHGNWYATQVAGIAWYLDKPEAIAQMVALTQSKLDSQLTADGRQPLELARTRSFHYSYFNLQALTLLAVLAQKNSIDLWHYQTPTGSGVLRALDFLAPYSDQTKVWPYKSLDRIGVRIVPLLSWADNAIAEPRYARQILAASYRLATPNLGQGHKTGERPDAARGAIIEAQRETWLLSLPLSAEGFTPPTPLPSPGK